MESKQVPAEFVKMVARASKKAQRRLRGMRKIDREDVIAQAILWCWENRDSYRHPMNVDAWFIGAVKNAKRKFLRIEGREKVDHVEADLLDATEDPSALADLDQMMDKLNKSVSNLPKRDRDIAFMLVHGYTYEDIREQLNVGNKSIHDMYVRLVKVQREFSEPMDKRNHPFSRVIENPHTTAAQDKCDDHDLDPKSWIDVEIAKLDFPPPAGADCPPCWLCKWYEGYLPNNNKAVKINIADAEVKEAIANTNARKIEIANQVRKG